MLGKWLAERMIELSGTSNQFLFKKWLLSVDTLKRNSSNGVKGMEAVIAEAKELWNEVGSTSILFNSWARLDAEPMRVPEYNTMLEQFMVDVGAAQEEISVTEQSVDDYVQSLYGNQDKMISCIRRCVPYGIRVIAKYYKGALSSVRVQWCEKEGIELSTENIKYLPKQLIDDQNVIIRGVLTVDIGTLKINDNVSIEIVDRVMQGNSMFIAIDMMNSLKTKAEQMQYIADNQFKLLGVAEYEIGKKLVGITNMMCAATEELDSGEIILTQGVLISCSNTEDASIELTLAGMTSFEAKIIDINSQMINGEVKFMAICERTDELIPDDIECVQLKEVGTCSPDCDGECKIRVNVPISYDDTLRLEVGGAVQVLVVGSTIKIA